MTDLAVLQGNLHQVTPVQLGLDHRLIKEGDARPGADQGFDQVQAAQLGEIAETVDIQVSASRACSSTPRVPDPGSRTSRRASSRSAIRCTGPEKE